MKLGISFSLKRMIWERLFRLSDIRRQQIVWFNSPPRQAWSSFDNSPWQHPWLTKENIRTFREFSDQWLTEASYRNQKATPDRKGKYAFLGNMANNMYSRARVLRKIGVSVDVFIHPHDKSLMGQPGWEEFDGVVPDGVSTLDQLSTAGIELPLVDGVHTIEAEALLPRSIELILNEYRFADVLRYEEWFAFLPILRTLKMYDAILAAQAPYLAYLSRVPYATTQMGGDIWYECSRDDKLGRIQRAAYRNASAYIFSNPWGLAFARRYGLKNLIYMPYLIDEEHYSPGSSSMRDEWRASSGGNFFVMITSRLDYFFKGSDIALQAFASFSTHVPDARLVITGWGNDKERAEALLTQLGILSKVIVVPVAGKRRLLEYLRSADCILDQFSMGYFGATGLEAFACGVPVVMRLARSQYDALIPEGAPPVCHAEDLDAAVAQLLALHANDEYRKDVGGSLREWFLATHGRRHWGAHYETLMSLTGKKNTPGFYNSPLQTELSEDEHEYHRTQLASAPIFPNYY